MAVTQSSENPVSHAGSGGQMRTRSYPSALQFFLKGLHSIRHGSSSPMQVVPALTWTVFSSSSTSILQFCSSRVQYSAQQMSRAMIRVL